MPPPVVIHPWGGGGGGDAMRGHHTEGQCRSKPAVCTNTPPSFAVGSGLSRGGVSASTLMAMLHAAYLHQATGVKLIFEAAAMPWVQNSTRLPLQEALSTVFFPIVFLFPIPIFLYHLVYEKVRRHRPGPSDDPPSTGTPAGNAHPAAGSVGNHRGTGGIAPFAHRAFEWGWRLSMSWPLLRREGWGLAG